jgi:hypothetical protein
MLRFQATAVSVSMVLAGCSGAATSADIGAGLARTESSQSFVRLANATSDAPPLDVCLRAHGAAADAPFDIGPLFETRGLSAGVAYAQASAYFAVTAGPYDLRVIAGDAPDCRTALDGIPDRTDLPSLDPNGYATIVATGSLAKSFFAVDLYRDDRVVSDRASKVRFIHATVAAPALDLGTKSGEAFAPIFTGVSFRSAASGGDVDSNGFVEASPSEDPTVALRVATKPYDVLTASGIALTPGTIMSMFSIGVAGSRGRLVPSLLACADLDASRAPLASCSVAP